MATNVGGVSCDIVNAVVNPLATRIDIWTVPGLNGIGAQNFAANDSSFQIRAIQYGTSAAIETWFNALRALQGTSISCETGPGQAVTHTGLLVIQSVRTVRGAVLQAGTTKIRGEAQLQGVIP